MASIFLPETQLNKNYEGLLLDGSSIQKLKNLVKKGEGSHLEFKRKAAHPDKIAKELIAFANTSGGTMLIGVDDDKSIPGIKYPEEESHLINTVLEKQCRPKLIFTEQVIRLSGKHFVLKLDIPKSERPPHYFVVSPDIKEAYIRVDDKCLKASREMREIIRRSRSKNGVKFTYGEKEDQLVKHLNKTPTISLDEFKKLASLNKSSASKKLILLVLGHVLKVTPTEKGDFYSRF
ncbi:MAG: ATP-binding protein [Bacteroidia bacterium]|nr:ATP-binding protein [Bacteroidia bacterium]